MNAHPVKRSPLLLLATVSLLAPLASQAEPFTFNSPTGDWSNPGVWTPDTRTPEAGDSVSINNSGTLTLSTTEATDSIILGHSTAGNTLTITNSGSLALTASSTIGNLATSSGALNINGSFSNSALTTVGGIGSGTINIGTGATATFGAITAGSSTGASGQITSGGTVTSDTLNIGNTGNGSLTIGGTWNLISGAGFTISTQNNSSGLLAINSGGTLTTQSTVRFGSLTGSNGRAIIRGTFNTTANNFFVGDSGSGNVTIGNGGTLRVGTTGSADLTLANTSNGNGTVNFGGAINGLTVETAEAAGILNARDIKGRETGGNSTVNFNHTGSNYHLTRNGTSAGTAVRITGAVTTVNAYSGTTTLSAANTYGGGTTIRAGAARVIANHNTALGTGAVAASNGGTLEIANGVSLGNAITLNSGNLHLSGGSVTGAISLSGSGSSITGEGTLAQAFTLASGHRLDAGTSGAAGTFAFADTLTLGTGSEIILDLFGETPGSYDRIAGVGETVAFGGQLTLRFHTSSFGGAPIELFNFATYSGSFASYNFIGLDPDQTAVFDASNGTLTFEPIPEPATFGLLAAAFAFCGSRMRRIRTAC